MAWTSIFNTTLGILGGALSIAIGALIIWGCTRLWQRVVRRPAAMEMSFGMGDAWTIKNVSHRPLLNAAWIGVNPDSTNMMTQPAELGMPDFLPNTATYLGKLQPGSTLVFNWIDRSGRRHAEVRIKADHEDTIRITPERLPRRRLRLTR